jgi:hypothetical protein
MSPLARATSDHYSNASKPTTTDWAGYDDREIYLREGLGLDPEAVDWALAGLRVTGVEAAVAFKEAQKLGRHGGDRRSEQAKADQGNNITLKRRGTDPAYITARLRKEGFDDLANAVAAKTLSARAAAREAGIIIPPTPLTIVRRAWKRMTPAADWFDALSRGCYLAAFRLFRSGQASCSNSLT